MSETEKLNLPLLEPAQAQKHVTVNEALNRLDGIVQLCLEDIGVGTPPAIVEGAWSVGGGATGDWFGQDGRIAVASNGGWDFVTPRRGWHAFVVAGGNQAVYNGSNWIGGAATIKPSGAGISFETKEFTHSVSTGPTSTTTETIPAQSLVIGVTGRVSTPIGGTATGFSLGIDGTSPDRYGSGYGLADGSWLRGMTSFPLTYYSDTPLTLTGEGGDLSGGTVLLSIHLIHLRLPEG